MWYVYILYDTRNNKPFYVGKGTKQRLKVTLNSGNSLKNKFIKEIRNAGLEPKIEIVSEHDNEDSALNEEKILIEHYGRIIKGTGILTNYADGGEKSNTGYSHTDETKQHWSSIRKGTKQSTNHILKRVEKNKGKKRTEKTRRRCVLASIRRTNVELKVKIIHELEETSYYHGMYVYLAKKFDCDQELISRIYNDIDTYKEALYDWIKK